MRLLFQSKTFGAAAISTDLNDWPVHFALLVRLALGGGDFAVGLAVGGGVLGLELGRDVLAPRLLPDGLLGRFPRLGRGGGRGDSAGLASASNFI